MTPLPDRNLRIEEQDDVILGAMLAWGEARGESDQGKLAVLEVVKNRMLRPAWWNKGDDDWSPWKRTILRPYQFSAFNAADPNRAKLLTPTKWGTEDSWASCYRAAEFIYHARNWRPFFGVARGADHYHTTGLLTAEDVTRWIRLARAAHHPLVIIGKHAFWELGPDGLEGTPDDLA